MHMDPKRLRLGFPSFGRFGVPALRSGACLVRPGHDRLFRFVSSRSQQADPTLRKTPCRGAYYYATAQLRRNDRYSGKGLKCKVVLALTQLSSYLLDKMPT